MGVGYRPLGLGQPQAGVLGCWDTRREGRLFAEDCRVMYVQPNHPLATDLGNAGEDPGTPFATVQAAINRCRPYTGDTVYVGGNDGWIYGGGAPTWNTLVQESAVLNVPGVRLVGVAPGLGVYWTAAAAGQFCLTVTALDCLIEGFAFYGGGVAGGCNGIYAEWDGATLFADNVVIGNCFFDDAIDTAIQLEYVWYGRIFDCVFQECDDYGIYVDPLGSAADYCNIHDNHFLDIGTSAMALNGCGNTTIFRNSVFNSNAVGGGAATDEGIDLTGGADNMVYDNYLSCILPAAAPGDYDDLNTAGAGDAWINNHCLNGDAVTNPA